MPHAEVVEGAFLDFGKTADAPKLAQRVEVVRAAGQQFPRVALVPHVPDEPILLGVEDREQGQRQFDHAEGGGQMPAVGRHGADDGLTQFGGQHFLFGGREARHHRGMRDAGKEGGKRFFRIVVHCCVDSLG